MCCNLIWIIEKELLIFSAYQHGWDNVYHIVYDTANAFKCEDIGIIWNIRGFVEWIKYNKSSVLRIPIWTNEFELHYNYCSVFTFHNKSVEYRRISKIPHNYYLVKHVNDFIHRKNLGTTFAVQNHTNNSNWWCSQIHWRIVLVSFSDVMFGLLIKVVFQQRCRLVFKLPRFSDLIRTALYYHKKIYFVRIDPNQVDWFYTNFDLWLQISTFFSQ